MKPLLFPRLAENRKVNPIFCIMTAFHLLSTTAVWMDCIFICFILWGWDCLFWSFVSLLHACGRGVLGTRSTSGLRYVLKLHLHSPSTVRVSATDLQSGSLACYLWEQSWSETMTAEWFMEMTFTRTNKSSMITPKLCSHMKSDYEQYDITSEMCIMKGNVSAALSWMYSWIHSFFSHKLVSLFQETVCS